MSKRKIDSTSILCVPELYGGCGTFSSSSEELCKKCGRRIQSAPNQNGDMLHIGQLVYFQLNGKVERGILALIKDDNVKLENVKRYSELKDKEVMIRHMARDFKKEKFDRILSIDDVASAVISNRSTSSHSAQPYADLPSNAKKGSNKKSPAPAKKVKTPKKTATRSASKSPKAAAAKTSSAMTPAAPPAVDSIFSPSRPPSPQPKKSAAKKVATKVKKTPIDAKLQPSATSPIPLSEMPQAKTSTCTIA